MRIACFKKASLPGDIERIQIVRVNIIQRMLADDAVINSIKDAMRHKAPSVTWTDYAIATSPIIILASIKFSIYLTIGFPHLSLLMIAGMTAALILVTVAIAAAVVTILTRSENNYDNEINALVNVPAVQTEPKSKMSNRYNFYPAKNISPKEGEPLTALEVC